MASFLEIWIEFIGSTEIYELQKRQSLKDKEIPRKRIYALLLTAEQRRPRPHSISRIPKSGVRRVKEEYPSVAYLNQRRIPTAPSLQTGTDRTQGCNL